MSGVTVWIVGKGRVRQRKTRMSIVVKTSSSKPGWISRARALIEATENRSTARQISRGKALIAAMAGWRRNETVGLHLPLLVVSVVLLAALPETPPRHNPTILTTSTIQLPLPKHKPPPHS